MNLAVDGIPNGLSNMNGTLVFDEDRLDVKDLTATTGGGQLKIGGSLSYQRGIFADLTATGDTVRVRYDGLSACLLYTSRRSTFACASTLFSRISAAWVRSRGSASRICI